MFYNKTGINQLIFIKFSEYTSIYLNITSCKFKIISTLIENIDIGNNLFGEYR